MMELLKQRSGANFVHVPYKGAAPAMVDVLGGQIPLVGAALAGSLAYIQGGQLRALSISSSQRSKDLPDVPTFGECGFDGLVITAWHGLLAPVSTPRPIVERLNRELDALLTDPGVQCTAECNRQLPRTGFAGTIRRSDQKRFGPLRATGQNRRHRSTIGRPAQPVDATQALNLSAGVSNCKVSRGRSLSRRATLLR